MREKQCIYKETKARTSYFYPVHPKIFLQLVEEQQKNISEIQSELHKSIQYLENIGNNASIIPNVIQYEGLKGFQALVQSYCEKDIPLYYISAHNFHDTFQEYIERVFVTYRKKTKNKISIIVADQQRFTNYFKKANKIFSEIYLADPSVFFTSLTICIHDNKVSYMNNTDNVEKFTGFTIENDVMYHNMLMMFHFLTLHNLLKRSR